MNEPVYIYNPMLVFPHEFWFPFEGKVFLQRSVDGIEWEEPELTPYPFVPFIQMSNLEPF